MLKHRSIKQYDVPNANAIIVIIPSSCCRSIALSWRFPVVGDEITPRAAIARRLLDDLTKMKAF